MMDKLTNTSLLGANYMQLMTLLLGSIMVANFVLAFMIIFLERKNATSTWAWLMVLFFIPVVGFFLYLIFGRKLSHQRIFKMDAQSEMGIEKEIEYQLKVIKEDRFTFKQDVLRQYKELYYLHLKHNSALYTQN